MIILLKISVLCIVSLIAINFSKKHFSDFAPLISLCCGLLVLLYIIDQFYNLIILIKEFVNYNRFSNELYLIMCKVVAISIICDFSSQLCIDSGEKFLADNINFAGKVIILSVIAPDVLELYTYLMDSVKKIC